MTDEVQASEAPASEAPVSEVPASEVQASEVPTSTPVQADSEVVGAAALAVTDGAYTLFVADFANEDAAWQAYQLLQAIDEETPLRVEGVLVVKRDASGELEIQKVTDPSTRRGLGWGIVGGAVLGILFPPSILGSVVVLGAAGAGIGKAREVAHRRELADELGDAIDPGHSGLVALVSDPAVVKVQKALEKADRIVAKAVDEALAEEIRAEAKAAREDAKSEKDEPKKDEPEKDTSA